MKIQGFQNVPSVLQTIKKDVSTTESTANVATGSSVTLSAFAETLQSLQRSNAQAAQVRQDKVSELSAQEQVGKLKPNLSRIAEKLQELNVIDMER
jgi:flagellar biosynthesis anti-sigma factor FlgM